MIVIVIGILVLAVLADLATHRIPNALIIISLILGLVLAYAINGYIGLSQSLKSIATAFVFFYLFYLIRALGAGDVKLFIVIALYLGATDAAKILSTSLVIGALYGCFKLIVSSIISKKNRIKKEADREGKSLINDKFIFDFKTINSHYFDYLLIKLRTGFGERVEGIMHPESSTYKFSRIPYSPFILLSTIILWRAKM